MKNDFYLPAHTMSNSYDPLDYVEQLEATGVPHEQATLHARALYAVLTGAVFKRELDRVSDDLRQEIHAAEERLRGEILASEARLRAENQLFEAQMDVRFKGIEAEQKAIRSELGMHRWAIAATLAIVSINAAFTGAIAMHLFFP
jgi:hypothetical protein